MADPNVAGPIALDYAPKVPARGELPRIMTLVCWGIFVSTVAQTGPGLLAELPIRDLLQRQIGTLKMSTFFFVAMAPWYFKPAAGLLSDAFPILGTRRKSYMILGAVAAGLLWLMLGSVPHRYGPMLAAAVLMNGALIVVSSSTAGLLVEGGQRLGASGRLSSARLVVMSAAVILGGLCGGILAEHHLFWATAVINGAILFSLAPAVLMLLAEPSVAVPEDGVFHNAWEQIKHLACSGMMWGAAGMLFLMIASPGFSSPLYEHLRDDLGFSQKFIGVLSSVQGAGGVAAALCYAWTCRRMNLRKLLTLSLLLAAAGVLPFFALHSHVHGLIAYASWGFGSIMAQLAALDLATRAAPVGVEAMGYALMVSAYNISLNLSDVSGSWLWGRLHHHFGPLVVINAGTTLLVLIAVPFLPRRLVGGREGERPAPARTFPAVQKQVAE